MVEELLKQIPPEKRWEITAKNLFRFSILRGVKTEMPLLGKEEGIIAPVWGFEKFEEIVTKVIVDGQKKFLPWVKETFNIPVEDAVGAAKLCMIAAWLYCGPGQKFEFAEITNKRVILRTWCEMWEIYKELEVDPGLVTCPTWCPAGWEAGLKVVNPKISYKFIKFLPRGDPYCEEIFELKER